MGRIWLCRSLLLSIWLWCGLWSGTGVAGLGERPQPQRPADITGTDVLDLIRFQPNRIAMDLENNGSFVSWNRKGIGGLEWPAGSGNIAVFAAGLWVAGWVNDTLRTAVAEYASEFQPGSVRPDGPQDPEDPAARNYIITRQDLLAALDGDPRTVPSRNYLEWPFADGASVLRTTNGRDSLDASGNPIPLLLGDEALWCVFNDLDPERHNFGTAPLGIEVQMYLWAYNEPDLLRDAVFLRFILINRSPNRVDSTFIGLWMDPDLGDALDDFVGVDTLLQMGYGWNDGVDRFYGSAPPAVGFALLRGPVAPAPADTAIFLGKPLPDHKNLPLAYFFRNVKHGTFGDPENAKGVYFELHNRGRDGTPVVDPNTGKPVRFSVPGDPVQGVGWYDGTDAQSADRRMLLSVGPFTFAPGDTQEVFAVLHLAQGTDPLSSIERLRAKQRLFNQSFARWIGIDQGIDPFPLSRIQPPSVRASAYPEEIVLMWDALPAGGRPHDEAALKFAGYRFEGFHVYELDGTSESDLPLRKRIATFDVVNAVHEIRDVVRLPESGEVVELTVARGRDSGLRHVLVLHESTLQHRPLVNYRTYFFGVSSYFYNPLAKAQRVLESALRIVRVMPQPLKPGQQFRFAPLDTVAVFSAARAINASHEGPGKGRLVVLAVDPRAMRAGEYEIVFEAQPGTDTLWSLIRMSDQKVVLSGQKNQSGDDDYLVIDGIQVKVIGDPQHPHSAEDRYRFSVPEPMVREAVSGAELVRAINVFPNPYYGRNRAEVDRLHRFVTFTHLPEPAVIRIFNLSGKLVRILEHDGTTDFLRWDLRNQIGVAVADGIYLAHIRLKSSGAQKVLKLAIMQPVDVPDYIDVELPRNLGERNQ